MPVEATNRSPKQHRLRFVSDQDRLEIILFPRRQLLRRFSEHVEKRQHMDQFKAPADIRRSARPAELIALRALAWHGASELARSRGLFKPAS